METGHIHMNWTAFYPCSILPVKSALLVGFVCGYLSVSWFSFLCMSRLNLYCNFRLIFSPILPSTLLLLLVLRLYLIQYLFYNALCRIYSNHCDNSLYSFNPSHLGHYKNYLFQIAYQLYCWVLFIPKFNYLLVHLYQNYWNKYWLTLPNNYLVLLHASKSFFSRMAETIINSVCVNYTCRSVYTTFNNVSVHTFSLC